MEWKAIDIGVEGAGACARKRRIRHAKPHWDWLLTLPRNHSRNWRKTADVVKRRPRATGQPQIANRPLPAS